MEARPKNDVTSLSTERIRILNGLCLLQCTGGKARSNESPIGECSNSAYGDWDDVTD